MENITQGIIMKLSQLNEASKKNTSIAVYFDKKSKSLKVADNKTPKNEVHSVKSKEEYIKLGKQFKINVTEADWLKLSSKPTAPTSKAKDPRFIKALEAMEEDILKKSDTKAYKGI